MVPSTTTKAPVSIDLVSAARNYLSFLYTISDSTLLHHRQTLLCSIRRYHNLWMPLLSRLSSPMPTPPLLLLPPLDVHWIWHCHCLHPGRYRDYCLSRFGVVVERPAIFDEDIEEYAYSRCRRIWNDSFPSEPFDLLTENVGNDEDACCGGGGGGDDQLLEIVERYKHLCENYSDLFVFESVFLVSARRRYMSFLHVCDKLIKNGSGLRLVPASDILLMWQTHQSFPNTYRKDMLELGIGDLERWVVGFGDTVKDGEVNETRRIWEEEFHVPYLMAGSSFRPIESPSRVMFYWGSFDADVNRNKYKNMRSRSMLEVLVFLKGKPDIIDNSRTSLRLQTLRCHREMKLDKPFPRLSSESWQKSWHLYCEFGTRGVVLLLREQENGFFFQRNKVIKELVFEWNELLRSTKLSLSKDLDKEVEAMVSVTPPVVAPYLLKCVPDRVTDDGGSMISDVMLRMNGYRPQRGRWLSRTVIDHCRRECFIIRIRIGEGFWRRGAETPRAVSWENRIIRVHEGPWSYVAGSSDGKAPQRSVGTATPKEKNTQEKKVAWSLSMGDSLIIQWDDDHELNFQFENDEFIRSTRLLRGRKLQYHVEEEEEDDDGEEDNFFTLVRFSAEYPNGKATALINWRHFAVEFLPEEDAVFVLLLCTIIIRTISEIKCEDVGRLLLRKRVNVEKLGVRDWGSVLLPSSSSSSSPYLNPWFFNATQVLAASPEFDDARQPCYWYPPSDGKQDMYNQVILF